MLLNIRAFWVLMLVRSFFVLISNLVVLIVTTPKPKLLVQKYGIELSYLYIDIHILVYVKQSIKNIPLIKASPLFLAMIEIKEWL